MIGKPYRIALRVNLPFAFMHLKLHIGHITLPLSAGRSVIKGICIRIDVDELELTVDHSGEHVAKMFILGSKLDIWPHLRARIPEPHGMYVACVDESVIQSVRILTFEVHCRI